MKRAGQNYHRVQRLCAFTSLRAILSPDMAAPSSILLAPLSALYGAVTRTRLALYRRGVFSTRQIGVPVISVGNITTGGTGKTPLVAWLARQLAGMGHRVCILTRGYGRADSSLQVVVSDGKHLLAEWTEAGDEPRLLAETLVGASAVISNADRVSAAQWAIENLNSSVFILDDGFQHLAIARDLNFVTIDSTNPWGGGRLLPRGHLREPLRGLARADAIVLTRANLASDIGTICAEASRLSGGRPVVLSQTHTVRVRGLRCDLNADETERVVEPPAQPVAAFCALGNAEAFFAQLISDGHKLAKAKSFPDHHVYTQSDLDALSRDAQTDGAKSFVTTAKDEVKLRGLRFEMPCYVVEIDMTFDDHNNVLKMLHDALQNPRFKKQ